MGVVSEGANELNPGPDRVSPWYIGLRFPARSAQAPSISGRDVPPELISMNFAHPLSDQLDALTDALAHPRTNLQAVVATLADNVTAAVPSFLGLTMTLLQAGRPVTVTAIDADLADAAGTSLRLPLERLAGAAPGSSVVFYAGQPGAFVDLAADTHYAYGLDGDVVLDGHLNPLTRLAGVHPGVNGSDEMTVINQAIGVLIARGLPPEEADDELLRRAAGHPRGLPGAAADLLIDTAGQ